jgi:hypothetical protein
MLIGRYLTQFFNKKNYRYFYTPSEALLDNLRLFLRPFLFPILLKETLCLFNGRKASLF